MILPGFGCLLIRGIDRYFQTLRIQRTKLILRRKDFHYNLLNNFGGCVVPAIINYVTIKVFRLGHDITKESVWAFVTCHAYWA